MSNTKEKEIYKMAMKKTEEVTIRSFDQLTTKIRIVGDSPLIVHNWSEKAKKEMLDAQTGKNKTKKKPCKMPFDDFARALYWITDMPTEVIKDPSTNEDRDVVTDLFPHSSLLATLLPIVWDGSKIRWR